MAEYQPNVARDTDGRGSANDASEATADPNVEAVTGAFEGRNASEAAADERESIPASGAASDGPDAIDLEDFSGASRREPGR